MSTARVEDSSTRYVAEENINLEYLHEPKPELMKLAGRFFKRWDELLRKFVSNIEDEYPDD
jgi:F-box protein 21